MPNACLGRHMKNRLTKTISVLQGHQNDFILTMATDNK